MGTNESWSSKETCAFLVCGHKQFSYLFISKFKEIKVFLASWSNPFILYTFYFEILPFLWAISSIEQGTLFFLLATLLVELDQLGIYYLFIRCEISNMYYDVKFDLEMKGREDEIEKVWHEGNNTLRRRTTKFPNIGEPIWNRAHVSLHYCSLHYVEIDVHFIVLALTMVSFHF